MQSFLMPSILAPGSGRSRTILRRLRVSTIRELSHRLRRAIHSRRAYAAVRRGRDPVTVPYLPHGTVRRLCLPSLIPNPNGPSPGDILQGRVFTLHEDPCRIRDYVESCMNRVLTRIPSEGEGPDIRDVWEPARLQHVTTLVAHVHACPDLAPPAIRRFIVSSIVEWLDRNPFLRGPHYLSAMECALRVPVFFYALHFANGPRDEQSHRILDALYRHGWWIARRLSLHASRGNHTLCESVGLIFAGAVFRDDRSGQGWLKDGIRLLEREVFHQIHSDGGPLEQSLAYHRFILDLCWLAADFLETNLFHDCSRIRERLGEGERFHEAFRDRTGAVPQIGDSDDGCALAPSVSPRRCPPDVGPSACCRFETSGYTVLRGARDALITFDHGPLGMPPLHNHGHADALSITLGLAGAPLLVDPGTYRYNGTPFWRRYFKGTRAHNTVTVDGLDQANQETSFIWSKPYRARVLRRGHSAGAWLVEAEHDGYRRLPNPLRHRRCVVLWEGRALLLRDTFEGCGEHDFALTYHLHPDVSVSRTPPGWRIDRGEARLHVLAAAGAPFRLIEGQMDPPLGWYSEGYGRLRPTPVLLSTQRGTPDQVAFLTLFSWEGPLTPSDAASLLTLTSLHEGTTPCTFC